MLRHFSRHRGLSPATKEATISNIHLVACRKSACGHVNIFQAVVNAVCVYAVGPIDMFTLTTGRLTEGLSEVMWQFQGFYRQMVPRAVTTKAEVVDPIVAFQAAGLGYSGRTKDTVIAASVISFSTGSEPCR